MILTPFKIVYELFVFGIQAAFVYGLALIFAIAFIAYVIASHPKEKVVYIETQPIVKEMKILNKYTFCCVFIFLIILHRCMLNCFFTKLIEIALTSTEK